MRIAFALKPARALAAPHLYCPATGDLAYLVFK